MYTFTFAATHKMASGGKAELYTTDFALEAQGATYRGLIVVNKVLKKPF